MKKNKIKSNPSKTTLTITIGLIYIYVITGDDIYFKISIFIGTIGVFSEYLSKRVEKIWFKIAEILGLIVPNILLSIVFYIFLLPISLTYKLFRKKDLLKLKFKKGSTYLNSQKKFNSQSFLNPW